MKIQPCSDIFFANASIINRLRKLFHIKYRLLKTCYEIRVLRLFLVGLDREVVFRSCSVKKTESLIAIYEKEAVARK